MAGYIFRRVLALIPSLFAVSLIVFLILKLAPGDPAAMIAGPDAPEVELQNVRRYWHLDDPLYVQYTTFLVNAAHGNLGVSLRTRRPVVQEIADRLPASAELALIAFCLTVVVGTSVGVLCATRQYGLLDNLATLVSFLGISMPVFWLGLMLILLFGVMLGWLPVGGNADWKGVILPAATLGLANAAIVARQTRSAMLEVLTKDYVRTARAKGLFERLVLSRHALRNAAIPTVTVLGLQIGNLLGGAVITEVVFAWPGIGRLTLDSIGYRDVPVVQGSVMVLAVVFLLSSLLVDLLYPVLDPRIKLA
jgi:peptide/nickel transport system permease protein